MIQTAWVCASLETACAELEAYLNWGYKIVSSSHFEVVHKGGTHERFFEAILVDNGTPDPMAYPRICEHEN